MVQPDAAARRERAGRREAKVRLRAGLGLLLCMGSGAAGLPAFQAEGWNALFAPKGTPESILAKLNQALRAAVAGETLQKRLADLAALPAAGEEFTPGYVRALVPREVEKYRVLLGK